MGAALLAGVEAPSVEDLGLPAEVSVAAGLVGRPAVVHSADHALPREVHSVAVGLHAKVLHLVAVEALEPREALSEKAVISVIPELADPPALLQGMHLEAL